MCVCVCVCVCVVLQHTEPPFPHWLWWFLTNRCPGGVFNADCLDFEFYVLEQAAARDQPITEMSSHLHRHLTQTPAEPCHSQSETTCDRSLPQAQTLTHTHEKNSTKILQIMQNIYVSLKRTIVQALLQKKWWCTVI